MSCYTMISTNTDNRSSGPPSPSCRTLAPLAVAFFFRLFCDHCIIHCHIAPHFYIRGSNSLQILNHQSNFTVSYIYFRVLGAKFWSPSKRKNPHMSRNPVHNLQHTLDRMARIDCFFVRLLRTIIWNYPQPVRCWNRCCPLLFAIQLWATGNDQFLLQNSFHWAYTTE